MNKILTLITAIALMGMAITACGQNKNKKHNQLKNQFMIKQKPGEKEEGGIGIINKMLRRFLMLSLI